MSQAKQEAKTFIESAVANNQIVVFAKSWCPYCNMTKELLNSEEFQNVKVQVYDLDKMPAGTPSGPAVQSVLAQMTGQRTVPNVWVGGEFLGGNDTTQEAYRNGKLQATLTRISANA